MGAAGISPEDAATNLATWAQIFGLDKVPSFLATQSADKWGMVAGSLLVIIGLLSFLCKAKPKKQISSNRQESPHKVRPNPFDLLVDECKAADAGHVKLTRKPETFIMHWVYFLERLRKERNTHNIENLFNLIGPANLATPGNGLVNVGMGEVLFTLRCLEIRGYLVLNKTSDTLIGGVGGHYNEEIKFTAKYDEFISKATFRETAEGYSVYW